MDSINERKYVKSHAIHINFNLFTMLVVILKCDFQIISTLLKHKSKWTLQDNNGFSCEKHWKIAYSQNVPPEIEMILMKQH